MTRTVAPKFEGFNRVVVNHEGEAWPTAKAIQAGIVPDVCFLRKDGWVLAAETQFEGVAYRMWADEWVGFCRKGEAEFKPMSLYGD